MGNVATVGHDTFPKQSEYVGRVTDVVFGYDLSRRIPARIVRDDREHPWMTILELVDGRVVLSSECQWKLPQNLSSSSSEADA